MGEFLHEVTSAAEEAQVTGGTARSTHRSLTSVSPKNSPLQSPTTTRSAICSAASTSDTISSNEEVHNYEEWELGFENEVDSKALANKDDDDDDNGLDASTDSRSPLLSSRSSSRSSEVRFETAPGGIDNNNEEQVQEESQVEPCLEQEKDQYLVHHKEYHRELEERTSEIDSARSVSSASTAESFIWANEPQMIEDEGENGQHLTSRPSDQSCDDGSNEASQSIESAVASRASSPSERPQEQDLKSVQRNIQVFVRVRPLPAARSNESREDVTQVVKPGDEGNSIRVQAPNNHGSNCVVTECSFDKVFMGDSTQENVFLAVQPSIHVSLEGYNATVFAYGQTGTGKTHTIFGEDADISVSVEEKGQSERLLHSAKPTWGIIPRAMAFLLDQAEELSSLGVNINLQCSFMQIYNDRLFDLLTDRRRQRPLIIREQPTLDGGTNVVLQGLSSERITSLDDALQVLRRGRTNRSVRETELNSCSSRSHAIVQINITSERALENGDKLVCKSRLNLVDLAGSEKWNTDLEMEEAHSQELKNINTSLSALGNCIAALSEAGRKHIPYRNSTLTRLLQDSFGGNTQACLIATISPSVRACEETIRTLQFADRARSVMQSVRVNETLSGVSELQIAKAQISKLRERLESEQRRRHQTRVKEQEAAQKEFLEKLQLKEKEIQKLARDNAVFSRWREEDLRKIRELESRVKELEIVAQVDLMAEGGKTGAFGFDKSDNSSMHAQAVFIKQHDEKENQIAPTTRNAAVNTPPPPQAGIKKTSSKKSISTTTTLAKKDETNGIKPYRQILERYALGSKKSNRRQPERRSLESVSQPLAVPNRSKQQGESQSQMHEIAAVAANGGSNQRKQKQNEPDEHEERKHATRSYGGSNGSYLEKDKHNLPEVEPTAEKKFDPCQSYENDNHAASSAASTTSDYPSMWESNLGSSYSASAMTYMGSPEAPAQINWDSSANLFDQAYRSYLQPFPSPAPNTDARSDIQLVKSGSRFPQWSSVQESSNATKAAFSAVSMKTTTSNQQSTFALQLLAPALATESSDTCEKHSLKGCVLCAVRDTRPQTILLNKSPPLSLVAKPSAEPHFNLDKPKPAPAARDGPCDRHRLASCFICSSSSSGPSLSSSLSQSAAGTTLSSSSSNNTLQHTPSSRCEEDSAGAAERNSLLMNDTKCDAHSLANCVLCTGVKAMSRKIQQRSPTRKAGFLPQDSSPSPSPFSSFNPVGCASSNQSLVLAEANSRKGLDSTTPSNQGFQHAITEQQASPFGTNSRIHQQQHPSILRRHSVDYRAFEPEGSSSSTLTSPVKLLGHLRPQQSAFNLHSTPSHLTSSYTPSLVQVQQQPRRIPGANTLDSQQASTSSLPYLSSQSTATAAAVETQAQTNSSPVKSSWEPTVAHPSIKELAYDGSWKSYQALIREASDAAAFVLRRR